MITRIDRVHVLFAGVAAGLMLMSTPATATPPDRRSPGEPFTLTMVTHELLQLSPDERINAPGAPASPARYAAAGTRRINPLVMYGDSFETGRFYAAGAEFEWYFWDDLSLGVRLMGGSYDQNRENAEGVVVEGLIRWHFYTRERWSLYLDGGLGVSATLDPVPHDGTRFNFTSQIGPGVSFEIHAGWRGMIGARFQHISNAGLSANNPGRNHAVVYAGLSIPF